MRVIALRTLRDFWLVHPEAEIALTSWYALTSRAQWSGPADIRAAYRTASFLPGNRVVFDIRGNRYRLVAAVHYHRQAMFIRFVGTHREYDRIDAVTI